MPSILEAQIVYTSHAKGVTQYVDPMIGSEGLGRVFIGPCCPFGMVKPGPDCGVSNNAGWSKDGELSGFSQTHVSGTGGGPKYGNILVAPQPPKGVLDKLSSKRVKEDVKLGYYTCTLENGIKTEITAAERASFYRFTGTNSIQFDLQHFLGRNPVPHAREAQQYEDSKLNILNDSVTTGYQCISGGWNNGAPYTVYFYAISKKEQSKPDGRPLWGSRGLLLKIGISFVSIDQAKQNLFEDIPHWNFQRTYDECVQKWEDVLGKVQLADNTSIENKKMFYTALYHTMLMPVDRTKDGETLSPTLSLKGKGDQQQFYPDGSPLPSGRAGRESFYDDYYAIWDTYRTNTPLLTLLSPQRETDIVNSLLNIYKQTGYMPDARSGNSNGRTQGGSNAEIVIADALAKGLDIDYKLALKAMLKDAEVAPKDDEAEGRGGLAEYNSLGYIPYGIARAGNRTIEYSFDDWAIAQVAKAPQPPKGEALQRDSQDSTRLDSIYNIYMNKSQNWKNLWRNNYEQDGVKGFIMPKDKDGNWLEEVSFGHSKLQKRTFKYSPEISYEGPWYCAWWDCFMYEASSWEYSLSVPHDVPGLIEACGGKDEFDKRLDTFFEHGYYNVANEPSFLTPMLYHWIGKTEKSNARVKQIIESNFNAGHSGLPGNDDGGAMSAWLAWHMLGLYPNAGHNYYLIHEPMIEGTILLDNGKSLTIKAAKGSTNECIFNCKKLDDWCITHQKLLEGGELIIKTLPSPPVKGGRKVSEHSTGLSSAYEHSSSSNITPSLYRRAGKGLLFTYKLHGQTRRFDVDIAEKNDSLVLTYGIQRNLKYWQGSYTMTSKARKHAKSISYQQPIDNQNITLPDTELFAILSQDTYKQIKKKGACIWCNTPFRLIEPPQPPKGEAIQTKGEAIQSESTKNNAHAHPLWGTEGLLHLIDDTEGAEMWVLDNPKLPLIMKMQNNPVEINWEVTCP